MKHSALPCNTHPVSQPCLDQSPPACRMPDAKAQRKSKWKQELLTIWELPVWRRVRSSTSVDPAETPDLRLPRALLRHWPSQAPGTGD